MTFNTSEYKHLRASVQLPAIPPLALAVHGDAHGIKVWSRAPFPLTPHSPATTWADLAKSIDGRNKPLLFETIRN